MIEMNSVSETEVMKLGDVFKRARLSVQMDIVIRRRTCSFYRVLQPRDIGLVFWQIRERTYRMVLIL